MSESRHCFAKLLDKLCWCTRRQNTRKLEDVEQTISLAESTERGDDIADDVSKKLHLKLFLIASDIIESAPQSTTETKPTLSEKAELMGKTFAGYELCCVKKHKGFPPETNVRYDEVEISGIDARDIPREVERRAAVINQQGKGTVTCYQHDFTIGIQGQCLHAIAQSIIDGTDRTKRSSSDASETDPLVVDTASESSVSIHVSPVRKT